LVLQYGFNVLSPKPSDLLQPSEQVESILQTKLSVLQMASRNEHEANQALNHSATDI